MSVACKHLKQANQIGQCLMSGLASSPCTFMIISPLHFLISFADRSNRFMGHLLRNTAPKVPPILSKWHPDQYTQLHKITAVATVISEMRESLICHRRSCKHAGSLVEAYLAGKADGFQRNFSVFGCIISWLNSYSAEVRRSGQGRSVIQSSWSISNSPISLSTSRCHFNLKTHLFKFQLLHKLPVFVSSSLTLSWPDHHQII